MLKKISKKLKIRKIKKAEKKLQKALKKEAKTLGKKQNTAFDKAVISWKAPEYIKLHKGIVWYSIFILLFAVGAYFAYSYSAWTFALALVAFAVTYLLFDKKMPKNVKVTLSDVGIKVGGKIYQYNRIRAFWVAYNPPFVKTLNIRVHNEYLVDIEIQLGDQDPSEVYECLSVRIPELEGKVDSFFTHLARLFKL